MSDSLKSENRMIYCFKIFEVIQTTIAVYYS